MSEPQPLRRPSPIEGRAGASSERLLRTTLDLLPVNVVITDATGRIMHVNSAAAAMLAAGDPIWSRHGRLCATTPRATAALLEAIAAAAHCVRQGHEKTLEVPMLFVDGRAAIAHVRTLERGTAREDSEADAAAALFITGPDRVAPPLKALARLFALTPAEIRVLREIVSGKNRKEAAAALRLADSTVKTHLENIYAKTGTSQQSALTRLVTNLCWPDAAVQPGHLE